MKTYEDLMAELDGNQQAAARIEGNAVIAAGAGSGKTSVLAARYVYLVVEKQLPVDEILALTFTTKAAAEMYSRIYATLRQIDHPLAREAVSAFHLARITTIDSFCNSVARLACRRYGVSPDFAIDNEGARDLAFQLALPFFLENRKSPAIRQLMKRYSQQELAESLLADTMVRWSPVSAPLDFADFHARQETAITERFPRVTGALFGELATLAGLRGGSGTAWEQITALASEIPDAPEACDRGSITAAIRFLERLADVSFKGRSQNPAVIEAKEIHGRIKGELFPEFLSLANYILNRELVAETFRLLGDFQTLFHRQKRNAGILTFADVSRLAVDALRDDPFLRASFKKSIKAVMIDEFQDDNQLQRDLLFLIAERPERMETSVPGADGLSPDKLFFVGDEKQSIYRFRGADVSVFRSLALDFAGKGSPSLATNYRTEAPLLDSFNRLLPSVFLDSAVFLNGDFPLYEATFSPIGASRHTAGLEPALELLLVNKCNFAPGDPAFLPADETEAAEVASRIRKLVDEGCPVRTRGGIRPCVWDDVAILFRSGTRQQLYEKHLRANGIPYQAESLRGLFNDAPVNDLYALLRLAVYPADNTAYATVLRSPLVGLNDTGFTLALSGRTTGLAEGETMPPPFGEAAGAALGDSDRLRFDRGRELYLSVRGMADRVPAAEVITRLWYDEGYRWAVLGESGTHHYAELYDYFFELARQSDSRGETLAAFLDRIAVLMENGKKIDDLDIPVDRSGGVRLMTVHKSKGLEFPVVFIVNCDSPGNGERNSEPVYFSGEYGISVNTGAADDGESARDNWFYRKDREEEQARERAEIRRLLYVAMTRAEVRLYLAGLFTPKSGPADNPRTGGELAAVIGEWLDAREESASKKGTPVNQRSFFDFLLPAFRAGPVEGVTLTEILPRPRHAGTSVTAASPTAAQDPAGLEKLYAAAPESRREPSPRTRYSASALHRDGITPARGKLFPPDGNADTPGIQDELDRLLLATGIQSADFGTFAHRTIEARFTGIPPFMPEELRPLAERMADRFFHSPLGIKAQKAGWRESEYGFITRYELDGREVTVSGQMDLLFDADGITHVVDYKTDRIEDPAVHAEQLAVYRKAAGDLRKNPVETWLFYLRSGRAVLVR